MSAEESLEISVFVHKKHTEKFFEKDYITAPMTLVKVEAF